MRQFFKQWLFETDYWIDEAQLLIVVKKNVVAILPDIGHKDILVSKAVTPLRIQSEPTKEIRNLSVVWTRIRPNCLLPEYQPRLMAILSNAKEVKPAVREKNVMDDVFEQHIFRWMPL